MKIGTVTGCVWATKKCPAPRGQSLLQVQVEEGELVAVGTHAQLYATCEEYRKMVDLQKLEEEGGAANG